MLKIVQKSRKLPEFSTILNIFGKLIFALKLNIWVLTPKLVAQKFSWSFYSRIKNDSTYNIAIFTSTSIFLLWLGEITHIHIHIVQPCKISHNHVQLCTTLYNHEQPCTTMNNLVQPCTTMNNLVQPFITMYNLVQPGTHLTTI